MKTNTIENEENQNKISSLLKIKQNLYEHFDQFHLISGKFMYDFEEFRDKIVKVNKQISSLSVDEFIDDEEELLNSIPDDDDLDELTNLSETFHDLIDSHFHLYSNYLKHLNRERK